jgi:hypothetical protein
MAKVKEVLESTEERGVTEAFDVDTLEADDDQELGVSEDVPQAADRDEAVPTPHTVQSLTERKAIIEALIYVADEPLNAKSIAEVLKESQPVKV